MYDRMTIKDIARVCKISTRTLRYYEEMGLITSARLENNYRVYGFDTVSQIEMIKMLQKTGMSLKEIEKELNSDYVAEELLAKQKRLLAEEKQKIDRMLEFVSTQQFMAEQIKLHGINQLYVEDREMAQYEIIQYEAGESKRVLMEYEDVHFAMEPSVNSNVYIVKELPVRKQCHIAAIFFSGEHRIKHRQRKFLDALYACGLVGQSLIYSESHCLVGKENIYYMWCEVDRS